MPNPICYLCGQPIVGAKASGDHVVPQQMISRAQPRARGYDYAGKIHTHEICNNRFGPEGYLRTAVNILSILFDQDAYIEYQHAAKPDVRLMVLDVSKFDYLSDRDKAFFKLIDGRDLPIGTLPSLEFFADKERTNPGRDALHVALSVVTKSAAALLVTRYLYAVPKHWRVFATAYWDETGAFDIDSVAGTSVPFDDGVKAWIDRAGDDAWQVAYRYGKLVVLMAFSFSDDNVFPQIRAAFGDMEIHEFSGAALNDLLVQGWTTHS